MSILKTIRGTGIKAGDTINAGELNKLFEETKKAYLRYHRDWYINDRFVRGDHWIVYNKTQNKIQNIPIADGEIRRTVNKIRSQMRGVKNFIKRQQPRWQAHPRGISNEDYEEAAAKNLILQDIYDTRKFKTKITDLVVNSLKYSAGIWEGGIVKKGDKEYIDFWVDDTFEIFIDPTSPSVEDARFIIKAVAKPVSYIKEQYKTDSLKVTIVPDSKSSPSEYKNLLKNDIQDQSTTSSSDELQTAIIKEFWTKWFDESGKCKIKVITVVNDTIVKVQDDFKYRRYPFFVYNPERDSGRIFSESWIKTLISINKSLDKTVSQVESYIQRMLAGKYLIKQGVEVSSITDKGAEKIYYKGSTPPVQQNLQPLPSAPFSYMANLERWIEELGGTREASLGRVPGSLQSGKAVEALQAADASTVSEPIENLELFLAEVGEFTLELIEDYQITSEKVVNSDKEVSYIGGNSKEKDDKYIGIHSGRVSVKIVPEISYSEEAKRDFLMRMAEAGLVDPETILEQLNFSNVADVMARVKKMKDEKFKEEMAKQKMSHMSGDDQPSDSADMAHQENMSMAAGQPVNPTPQALWTKEHTELHMIFIQENRDAYDQHKDLFDEHIANELQYSEEGSPQEAPQQGGDMMDQGMPDQGMMDQEMMGPEMPQY